MADFVLPLTTAAAAATNTARATRWDSPSIDCDDLTDGLIAVGIYPADWQLPPHPAVTIRRAN